MVNYYVDPGSGFVFAQNTSFLWGIALGLLGSFFFFFKFFFRFLKRSILIFLILLAILIIGGLTMHKERYNKKVIILGIDGMDPDITRKLMENGRLPNFSYLNMKGSYSSLATTLPAESAVAWTTFATGLNPGGHGIFDFVMRDPKTYFPYLSLNEISTVQGRTKTQIRRKGDTFWKILSKNKVPCFIYFCPNTFPPDRVFGKMLSGMGVPDISGTMGKFSFYTSKALTQEDKNSRGRIIEVMPDKDAIETELYGPKVNIDRAISESKVPLRIILRPAEDKIEIYLQNRHFSIKKGAWSDWQNVTFKIGPFKKARGILRFYLKSINPELELYCSPINFDPKIPLFPISYPDNFSSKLAKKIGPYYTQGMPHDTWILDEDKLDEKAFLEQVDEVLNEYKMILKEELKQFKGGLFFFYFETLDTIQHMFWRYLDSKHPIYEESPLYKDTIFRYYEKMDEIIGEVLRTLDKDTTLIILSDHGFNSFRKGVHLNRWLLKNGYLSLKEGKNESKEFFEDVDWSKTKAYALGLGGEIYLNRIGREYHGIVDESEIRPLKEAIALGLKQFEDPQTNERIVKNVYFSEDVFKGPYINDAPDILLGFNVGYRASWQTALGGTPNLLIEDNKRKWGGEHIFDPTQVPGVIFVNKKINLKNPSIIDFAPTILSLFNINKPEDMPGKSLFNDSNR